MGPYSRGGLICKNEWGVLRAVGFGAPFMSWAGANSRGRGSIRRRGLILGFTVAIKDCITYLSLKFIPRLFIKGIHSSMWLQLADVTLW